MLGLVGGFRRGFAAFVTGRDWGLVAVAGLFTFFGLAGAFAGGLAAIFSGTAAVDPNLGTVGGTSGVDGTSIISSSCKKAVIPGGGTES